MSSNDQNKEVGGRDVSEEERRLALAQQLELEAAGSVMDRDTLRRQFFIDVERDMRFRTQAETGTNHHQGSFQNQPGTRQAQAGIQQHWQQQEQAIMLSPSHLTMLHHQGAPDPERQQQFFSKNPSLSEHARTTSNGQQQQSRTLSASSRATPITSSNIATATPASNMTETAPEGGGPQQMHSNVHEEAKILEHFKRKENEENNARIKSASEEKKTGKEALNPQSAKLSLGHSAHEHLDLDSITAKEHPSKATFITDKNLGPSDPDRTSIRHEPHTDNVGGRTATRNKRNGTLLERKELTSCPDNKRQRGNPHGEKKATATNIKTAAVSIDDQMKNGEQAKRASSNHECVTGTSSIGGLAALIAQLEDAVPEGAVTSSTTTALVLESQPDMTSSSDVANAVSGQNIANLSRSIRGDGLAGCEAEGSPCEADSKSTKRESNGATNGQDTETEQGKLDIEKCDIVVSNRDHCEAKKEMVGNHDPKDKAPALVATKNGRSKSIAKQNSKKKKNTLQLAIDDSWYPTEKMILRERRIREYSAMGSEKRCSNENECAEKTDEQDSHRTNEDRWRQVPGLRERFESNPMSPGVVGKIPHCRVHARWQQRKGIKPQKALFCFQVTELHPDEVMVCCSRCNTWRHAACGGQHNWCNSNGNGKLDMESPSFAPVCNLCIRELPVLEDPANKDLAAVIQRQRVEHLRKSLAVNQVVRYAAFSKHSGTYKWPLGSVSSTHIGGHTRSVNGRHEKAIQQWEEMLSKLETSTNRPREHTKIRAREFERVLNHIEEAELVTDRHNMMLFLQRDTDMSVRDFPVGYEKQRMNLFDPLDDEIYEIMQKTNEELITEWEIEQRNKLEKTDLSNAHNIDDTPEKKASNKSEEDCKFADHTIKEDEVGSKAETSDATTSKTKTTGRVGTTSAATEKTLKSAKCPEFEQCARPFCLRKTRHNSIFCSDGCGVAALETDLLNNLEYSEDIHPVHLRM